MTVGRRIPKKFLNILSEILAIIIILNAIHVPSLFSSDAGYLAAASEEKEELLEALEEFEDWAAEARKGAEEEANNEALESIEEAESLIELARDEAGAGNIDEAWEYLDQVDKILSKVDAMLYGGNDAETGCGPSGDSDLERQPKDWNAVDSFAYQLQEINFQNIVETEFDLVITDYSADGSDEERFTESQIRCLQDGEAGRRQVLAYMSIGEAEDYRWYWEEGWDSNHDGNPDDAPFWLGPSNPEWFGNYKVKYWDPNWKSIVFGYIDRVIEAGFDGIYLDIIDAYEYWGPEGESGFDRTTAEQEMVDFVIEIAEYARETSGDSEFGVFPQNGDALASHPEYVEVVTGIGREDLWYLDNTPQPPSDINAGIQNLDKFKEAGKLVLVTDYPTDEDIINDFYSKAIAKGYIPYAAVRDLDQLIERYPPERETDRDTEEYSMSVQATTVSNLLVTDSNGNELEAITKGSLIVLGVTIQNNNVNEEQPFLLILEVRNELEITTSLQFQKGILNPDGKVNIGMSWTPEESGSYEIRSFAISSLQDAEVLSPILQESIKIM